MTWIEDSWRGLPGEGHASFFSRDVARRVYYKLEGETSDPLPVNPEFAYCHAPLRDPGTRLPPTTLGPDAGSRASAANLETGGDAATRQTGSGRGIVSPPAYVPGL